MLGLFNTLNLGARSLQAQQAGVEITGQNLANVNNPAYARQRVQIQTTVALNSGFGPQGTGVQVTAIEQLRDALIDAQIRDEASVGGYWNSQQNALQNAQAQLGNFLNPDATGISNESASASATTLSDQLNHLFNAFQSVATNPGSLTHRQALVNQAQSLATSFNHGARNLTSLHNLLNTSLNNDVASANELLTTIANLNDQIARTEMATSGNANDLRDLRQGKLEELAKLVNFQAGTDANGALTLSADGNQLIAGNQVLDTLQTYDAGGGQILVRTATSAVPLALGGGSIQGTMDVRDGALQTLRNNLDTLASALVTEVNAIYGPGYDLNGNTGGAFFTGTNAASIAVNNSLLNDSSLVQAAGAPGTVGDNSIILALAQLGREPIASLGNQTFSSAHAMMAANLGNAMANVSSQVANFEAVNTMLLQQRDSVAGVSIDEEMANLLSFQKAYAASAKIISTVDQMLDTILAMKR